MATVAALAAMVLTFSLGQWQLGRAAQKEQRQQALEAQQALAPLEGAQFLARSDLGAEMHRRVRLRGRWLADYTVYLDNRQMRGLQGFFVLTPLAIEGAQQVVMVQRGWVGRDFAQRERLPPLDTPSAWVELEARIEPPPAQLLQLGAESPRSPAAGGASRIRQNLNLPSYRQESGLPLRVDLSLQQLGPASEGLLREWPAPALGIEKHYGYAFQWWGLTTLLLILYVWFQFIAPRRRHG